MVTAYQTNDSSATRRASGIRQRGDGFDSWPKYYLKLGFLGL